MPLVDTSIWIDHLALGNRRLAALLEEGQVHCHPMVIGELACGNLADRRTILSALRNLPQATCAIDREALMFIEHHAAHGRGLGWVDVHLLAACSLANLPLWTRDRRLQELAGELELAFESS